MSESKPGIRLLIGVREGGAVVFIKDRDVGDLAFKARSLAGLDAKGLALHRAETWLYRAMRRVHAQQVALGLREPLK